MDIKEQIQQAQTLEKQGKWVAAAIIYQKIFDRDQGDLPAISRLLVIYRKLKEYRKELAVIEGAMDAYRQHEKTVQDKWIKDHPKAAGIGRSMLRKLGSGSEKTPAIGADPAMNRWLKRKVFVTARIKGYKAPKNKPARTITPAKPARSIAPAKPARAIAPAKPARAIATGKPSRAIPNSKPFRPTPPRLPPPKTHPSLFIISLTYLASLEKIDAAMPGHIVYLNRHYKKGDFLVSGRKLPRTGGIIIARGTDRQAIEKIIQEDPFVKKELAIADLLEFSASQVSKGLKLFK